MDHEMSLSWPPDSCRDGDSLTLRTWSEGDTESARRDPTCKLSGIVEECDGHVCASKCCCGGTSLSWPIQLPKDDPPGFDPVALTVKRRGVQERRGRLLLQPFPVPCGLLIRVIHGIGSIQAGDRNPFELGLRVEPRPQSQAGERRCPVAEVLVIPSN